MERPIYLSPSQIANADDCRRKHWYTSIAKVRTTGVSANLVFGSCVDVVVREHLHAITVGSVSPDLPARFLELWKQKTAKTEVIFSSTKSPAEFIDMGQTLAEQFPAYWDECGYQVAIDAEGRPMLDLKLEAELGNGVRIRGVLDVAVYNPQGAFGVTDVKTAATAHSDAFCRISDQLTTYNVLIDAHQEKLGLPPLERLGFLDLIKRKNARIEPIIEVPRRRPEAIEEFIRKCKWIADDIRRNRFPRVSRHAYNTPCDLCDFSEHCLYGNRDGLIIPNGTDFTQHYH